MAKKDYRMLGVPHPNLENAFVFQSPSFSRFPSCVFLFTVDIESEIVILQNAWIANARD